MDKRVVQKVADHVVQILRVAPHCQSIGQVHLKLSAGVVCQREDRCGRLSRQTRKIGKGFRGAPRDALVADVTPRAIRGRAFGLRQSLDTIGAFAGPLLAMVLMAAFADDMRRVFWIAVLPAVLAVLCVIFGVKEPRDHQQQDPTRSPIAFADLKRFDRPFWIVVAIGVVFALARFSEAFLILKASGEGLPLTFAPAVLVVMNVVYALGAYPAGVASDKYPAPMLLGWGLAFLILADLVLALRLGLIGAFVGIALWGLHMALTQGLMAKLVVDRAPLALRGSAFGLFNLATGLATLVASLLAGLLWDRFGANSTFFAGAGFATIALIGLFWTRFMPSVTLPDAAPN